MELQDRHRFKLWDKRFNCFFEQHDIAISMWLSEPTICIPHHREGTLEAVWCTGLKDVEGTLIYEGDILDIQGARAIVEWVDDGWKLIGDGFNGDNLFPQIRSVEGANDGKAMWGKIVGNRFEHNVDEIMKGQNV